MNEHMKALILRRVSTATAAMRAAGDDSITIGLDDGFGTHARDIERWLAEVRLAAERTAARAERLKADLHAANVALGELRSLGRALDSVFTETLLPEPSPTEQQ